RCVGVRGACTDGSVLFLLFSSRRRHTRLVSDWSSDVCSSDLSYCAARSGGAVTVKKRYRRASHCGRQAAADIERLGKNRAVRLRSEERRGGKERGGWWSADH